MPELHYGYPMNEHMCRCGRHFGTGAVTPEQRALRAGRMRDTMPQLMPDVMRAFLDSWEAAHGRVCYTMQNIGLNSGTFVKSNKGSEIMGPVVF